MDHPRRPRQARPAHRIRRRRALFRLAFIAFLAVTPLGSGGCGTGYGGGGRTIVRLAGGVLPPEKLKYAVSEASDLYLAAVDEDALPGSVDLRRDDIIPPVQNQRWNSCVGWTLGYGVMTALEARHMRNRGAWLDMRDPANWFSPDYVYSSRDEEPAREDAIERRAQVEDPIEDPTCFEADGELGCMRPEAALNLLTSKGCCRWSWMCSDDATGEFRPCGTTAASGRAGSRLPIHLATAGADRHRARCYVRFGALNDFSLRTESLMRHWLHEQGTPIAIVVRMTSGWVTYRGENRTEVRVGGTADAPITETRGVCLDAVGDELQSQHMMTVIGYDKDFPDAALYPDLPGASCGSFLVMNHWGEKWGDRGFMWIPCAELAKIWIAGYGLIRAEYGAAGSPSAVCLQDESGRVVVPVEADDVAVNLVCVPRLDLTCSGVWKLADEPTANGIILPAAGEEIALEHTVGGDDPADWFWFEIEADHTPVAIGVDVSGDPCPAPAAAGTTAWTVRTSNRAQTLTGTVCAEPHRILDWKLTDQAFTRLGTVDPSTGRIQAVLCKGVYYVKVAPNRADLYDRLVTPSDPEIPYTLRVQVDSPDSGPATCENEPAATDTEQEPLRSEVFEDQQVEAGGACRLYRVAVCAGTELRVHVADVEADAPVQVTVGLFGATPQAPHLHRVKSRLVEEGEGDLRLRPPTDLHWSIVDPGQSWSEAFVCVRSANPATAAGYSLRVEIHGVSEKLDPPVTVAVPASELDGRWRPMPTDAFMLLPAWECCRRDRLVIQLSDFGEEPRLLVTDAAGQPLAGVKIEDVHRRPGLVFKRVRVDPDVTGDIWMSVIGGDGEPLEQYALQRVLEWSLADWPFVEFSRHDLDENDEPTRAASLVLDAETAHADTIGLSYPAGPWRAPADLPAWDYWDFYRVQNTLPEERRIKVSLGGYTPGAAMILSVWERYPEVDPGGTVRDRYVRRVLWDDDWVSVPGFSSKPPLEITVTAAPGETVTIMVECFSDSTDYEIRATSD